MESAKGDGDPAAGGLRVRMLGPLLVQRGGVPVELPSSRKLRALFAYLALSAQPVGRSRLCEILWDGPNDPRGELRWCLSKLRGVISHAGHDRVRSSGDFVGLDLSGCRLDAAEVAEATARGPGGLDTGTLAHVASLFVGDFMEGLEVDRSPAFDSWLVAQRRRFRAAHTAVLEQLVERLPPEDERSMRYVERWLELSPFDGRAHVALLQALAARDRIGEGDEHLEATEKLFSAEGLDIRPVRMAWRSLRDGHAAAARPAAAPRSAEPPPAADPQPRPQPAARRSSLAVMPFREEGGRGALADGLTHDIITRLAKLRSLFIIARGSVYALADMNLGPEEAARRLNTDYVASGSVRQAGPRIIVGVELAETHSARIVWAETFEQRSDDIFSVLEDVGDRIVASIAGEIELAERNRALLKPPNSLDAWEAYHRGLWHMYRFTRDDNGQAQHFFRMAADKDPTFARAHAGLSFTHWQNAFQNWEDRERESALAFETAGRGLIVDDHDPAAHWAMGRAMWLRGQADGAVAELNRAVELSPNFALGHYALSFVHSQSGDPRAAISSSDHSRQLSPFDPLLFGMYGARAMAHVRLGEYDEAAEWSLKALARPNSHAVIQAIAAHCLALAGRLEEARSLAAVLRANAPGYSVEDFLATFRFSPDATASFRKAAGLIGLR